MNPALVTVAIQQVPEVLAFLRDIFQAQHPDQPEPTDAEIIAAYQAAFESSLAKDDQWLAEHPAS